MASLVEQVDVGVPSNAAAPGTSSTLLPWLLKLSFGFLFLLFASNGSFSFQGSGASTSVQKTAGLLVRTETAAETSSRHATLIVWEGLAVVLIAAGAAGCVRTARKQPFLILLPLFAFVSILWSASRGATLRAAFSYILCTLALFALCSYFKGEERDRFFVRCGLAAAVASVLVAVLMPRYGQDYVDGLVAWRGIFNDKNICALAMVLFLATATSRARWWTKVADLALAAICLAVLLLTQSRTGWVDAAVYIAVTALLALLSRFRGRDMAVIAIGSGAAVVALIGFGESDYGRVLTFLGKDTSLTGRTEIWAAVWKSILEKPWMGYGYGAFWNGIHGPSAQVDLTLGWMVPHAHNGFLDLWLGTGAVGVALFVASLISALRSAMTCFSRGASQRARWYLALMVVVLTYNISEVSLGLPLCFGWVCYVVACIGLHEEAELAGDSWRSA